MQTARAAAVANWSITAVMLGLHVGMWTGTAGAADPVSFVGDVAPVLARRCEGCHGQKHADAGLRVDSFEHLMDSAATDHPLIVPGDAAASELYQRIINSESELRMPQEDEPLTPEQTELIGRWIHEGAAFDGSDESLPLRRVMPPRRHPAPPDRYSSAIPIFALAFSPGGDELAVSGYHEVTIWDVQTGKLLRRIDGLPERIDDLEYSPDGGRLLVGGGSPGDYGELTLVDPLRGERRQVLGTFEDVVLGVAFSRDGSRVAAGSADQTVRVYDVEGPALWDKRVHADWVPAVSFSHDDRFLASASRDMTVKVFEASTGELFTTYTGHKKQFGKHSGEFEVYGVAFAADTLLACSAGTDKVARLWNPIQARDESGTAADMEQRFSQEGHTRYIEHGSEKGVLALVLDAGDLFCAGRDGRITQHAVESGEQVRVYDASPWRIFDIAHHAPSHRLASGSFDGTVHIWDTADGRMLHTFVAAPGIDAVSSGRPTAVNAP